MSESKILITDAAYKSAIIKPTRMVENMPRTFRQARKSDGAIVLQGGYLWSEGFNNSGIEWRELSIVDIDANGNEIQKGGAE